MVSFGADSCGGGKKFAVIVLEALMGFVVVADGHLARSYEIYPKAASEHHVERRILCSASTAVLADYVVLTRLPLLPHYTCGQHSRLADLAMVYGRYDVIVATQCKKTRPPNRTFAKSNALASRNLHQTSDGPYGERNRI